MGARHLPGDDGDTQKTPADVVVTTNQAEDEADALPPLLNWRLLSLAMSGSWAIIG